MYRLYELIWNRFLACQMVPAVYDQTAADISAGRATFRATGSILKFPGYLAVYGAKPPEEEAGAEEEKKDETEREEGAKNVERQLPPLEQGEELRLVKLNPEQHFTQPPPRYNESSLVKEMEQRGIGRPSTYAAILETIQEKTYVEKVEKNFKPTHLGVARDGRARPRLPAGDGRRLHRRDGGEARRDRGGQRRVAGGAPRVLRDVQGRPREREEEHAQREEAGDRDRPRLREVRAQAMVIKWGRNGEFLACPGYPECRNTMNFRREEDGKIVPVKEEEIPVDEKCPECAAPMVMKRGRFGRFLACTRYPDCKGTKPVSIGVTCPKACGGYVSEKRSKRGRTFYGCSSYPKCDFVSWDRPRNEACPKCGSAYLLDKFSKKTGPFVACPNKECDYRREAPPQAETKTG